MAMKIDADLCTSCGDCEPECPTDSIRTRKGITKIDAETCTECEGDFDKPKCVELCPIKNCIVQLAA
jgi:ferredoxin